MIIRFPRQSARPGVDEPQPLICACGHRSAEPAQYCRRCGEPFAAAAVQTSGQTSSQPAATSAGRRKPLAAWEQLPRPTGITAGVVRARRHLARRRPATTVHHLPGIPDELSARKTLTWSQVAAVRWVIAAFLMTMVVNAQLAVTLVIALATGLYLAALVFRVRTYLGALSAPEEIRITDDEARSLWDRSLPVYTVLVPAYHEPEVIGDLIAHLDRLEYPRDRLDIKLLLEEDDTETLTAARAAVTGDHYEIIEIPYSEPRTKPKALNFGLRRARGRRGKGMVTIYDVEDRPDPLQLRRAVAAFRAVDDSVACLQAKLAYHNTDQNIITRWFTVEYAMWFGQLLPGLVAQSAPLPLGGTSNHFRRASLEELGGWDAYNVTEDADLGVRLHRAGYRTRVLDSVTQEEANSDFVNWIKQRSRWYKGYMQTFLVHMRHPRQLRREVGSWGVLGFCLFVGGTPFLALVNPLFWTMTVLWFIARPELIAALFPPWLYYLNLLCLVVGNFAFVYTFMLSARLTRSPGLVLAAAISPAYWVMMSIAAIKALLQLINAPSFWEKTFHGLDRPAASEVHERVAA